MMAKFTEKQLNQFDRLTKMISSKDPIEVSIARLAVDKWILDNSITEDIIDAMTSDLILRGRW